MKSARVTVFLVAAAFAAGTIAHADDAKPQRHLVFTFGVTIATTSTEHTSGIDGNGGASGSVDSHGSVSDTGTIIADVLSVQPDTGLVVRISENGRGDRNSAPTMCVTYATGVVLCDMTAGGPNEEEMSLLRVLGKDFVNPVVLDAKNHWRTSAQINGGTETNDYRLDGKQGDLTSISFDRVLDISGVNGFNAATQGHIMYNEKTNVPVNMTEDTITRKSRGAGSYDTIDQKMTFTLSSDSLAQTTH
ncbi:MAG: hypothetical protein ABR508_03235 [Candidatus Baltobacteraceae bacterium]